MSANDGIWRALAAEFRSDEVRRKPASGGRQVGYVTARAVMNRLDEVLGPENWTAEYAPFGGTNSVLCKLSILLPDGTRAVKCDVGGAAGMPDEGDDDKSAVSDALKRAAVQFGVGRHLYNDGVPRCFGADSAANPPGLASSLPTPSTTQTVPSLEPAAEPRRQGAPPATGRDLYRWAKDNDHLAFLARIGKSWGFPGKILDWSTDQVEGALRELHAKERAPSNGAERRWG